MKNYYLISEENLRELLIAQMFSCKDFFNEGTEYTFRLKADSIIKEKYYKMPITVFPPEKEFKND